MYSEILNGCSFDDVLYAPKRSGLKSRKDADISVRLDSLRLHVPFLSAPMPSVASTRLLKTLNILGGLPVIHRFQNLEEQAFQYQNAPSAIAIGIHDGLKRTEVMINNYQARIFVLDVAHGHSDPVIEFIERWKYTFNTAGYLIAGNVATSEGAYDLAEAGADAIKVGIGPGSVCTTRQVTGCGVPQLQAINHAAAAVEVPVIADGGIRNSGDIVKALMAGADAVMIGSLFANTEEAGGTSHYGCASKQINGHHAPEGTEVTFETPPRLLTDVVKKLSWGLKSGISYAGARNIAELQESPEWIRLSDAGRRESKL